jgi:hypothetical protein
MPQARSERLAAIPKERQARAPPDPNLVGTVSSFTAVCFRELITGNAVDKCAQGALTAEPALTECFESGQDSLLRQFLHQIPIARTGTQNGLDSG